MVYGRWSTVTSAQPKNVFRQKDGYSTFQKTSKNVIFKITIYKKYHISVSWGGLTWVINTTFVGISQYNHYCYFPYLVEMHTDLLAKMQNYLNSIREEIPYPHYIVDIAIINETDDQSDPFNLVDKIDLEKYGCKIIELNAYERTGDACLFDWDKDDHLLLSV